MKKIIELYGSTGTANTCRAIHKLAQIISTNIGLQAQGIQLFLQLDLRWYSTKIICIGERSGKVVEGCGISLGKADFGTAEVSFEILAHITEWLCGRKLWDAQVGSVGSAAVAKEGVGEWMHIWEPSVARDAQLNGGKCGAEQSAAVELEYGLAP